MKFPYNGSAVYSPANGPCEPLKLLVTLLSIKDCDGWVLESGENTNVGGTMDSASASLRVGDAAGREQYRSILCFDTSSLPDNAAVSKVTLKVKKQGGAGADPFTTHGSLLVDVIKGVFSGNVSLQLSDFQAAPSKSAVGTIPNAPSGGWYARTWTSGIFPYINLIGQTQFRLRFQKDDDNDAVADTLSFFSGDAAAGVKPTLLIEYTVP